MKQLETELRTPSEEEQMSTDYLLLHTAFKAGEEQRRRKSSAPDTDRRQSVPRIYVDHDGLDAHHRRTHSLKCPSSSPVTQRQSTAACRRAGSVKSTPPRSVRNASNASPKVLVVRSSHRAYDSVVEIKQLPVICCYCVYYLYNSSRLNHVVYRGLQ